MWFQRLRLSLDYMLIRGVIDIYIDQGNIRRLLDVKSTSSLNLEVEKRPPLGHF